ESASSLHQGERIEVRSCSPRNEACNKTLTLPSPLQRERRLRARLLSFEAIVQSSEVYRRKEFSRAGRRALSRIHARPRRWRDPSNGMAGTPPCRENERLESRSPGRSIHLGRRCG